MIDLNRAANDNERLALTLFKAMEDGDLAEKIEVLCADGFAWANSGLPSLEGKAAVFAHMAAGGFANDIPILKGMTSFSADLLHIASSPAGGRTVVFTERIDHHWDAAGRDLMTPHICGVIEIEDGQIQALRDFYDTCCYEQEPVEPGATSNTGP